MQKNRPLPKVLAPYRTVGVSSFLTGDTRRHGKHLKSSPVLGGKEKPNAETPPIQPQRTTLERSRLQRLAVEILRLPVEPAVYGAKHDLESSQ